MIKNNCVATFKWVNREDILVENQEMIGGGCKVK